ncbi:MAG: Lrp/AsnC family transcriptional regulator [Bacteroidaceae bacterium]|jgi:Lrp/AsnC family leucine-responsive transcriptional regulator|nr:Lrp/AsnC family transcriptional regulator [Bacteroidaceae bacterium]
MGMTEQLDKTDLMILRTLQENAKLTTKELAEAVNLSTTPVFERVKRMERQGFIKKYIAVIDAEKLGMGFMVFCNVKMRHMNHDIASEFERRITEFSEVTECYNTSGNFDFLLKVHVKDMAQYREFVLNKLGTIESLGSIESTFVMSEIKHNYGIYI